jgi:hypothetical protein
MTEGERDFRSDAERARIAGEVRTHFGPGLALCEQLRDVGVRAVDLGGWQGRPIEADTVDVLIAAEAARATKTYLGALSLVMGGYGTQAMMLTRSLFEGTVVAHWATLEPEAAWKRFVQHGRHAQLLWGQTFETEGWQEPTALSPEQQQERKQLDNLFGKHGQLPWTGLNTWKMVEKISHLWDDDGVQLQRHQRIALRDANEVLHATASGLIGSAAHHGNSLGFDAFPSGRYIARALISAFWCYLQTLSLLFDHFGFCSAREEVRQLSGRMEEAFGSS